MERSDSFNPLIPLLNTEGVQGPGRSQSLISDQFFVFRQPKNWLMARETGSRGNNCLHQELGTGLL